MRISWCPDTATRRQGLAQDGFTLIELLIVMSLIAIVYALALPAFGTLTADGRLNSATNALHAELRAARAQALLQGRSVVLDPTAGVSDPDIRFSVREWGGSEAAAAQNPIKDRQVRFFPDGSATGAQIVLSLDDSQRVVDLDWLTGKVSVGAQ